MIERDDRFLLYFIKFIQLVSHLISYVYTSLFKPDQPRRLPKIEDPLLLKSAVQLSREIREGQLEPLKVIETYLHRINSVNPLINAAVQINHNALTEAKKLNDQTPSESQPLFGIPFTSKDNIPIEGLIVTNGLPSNATKRCEATAKVIEYMWKAGAIHTAVTNVPEFCMYHDSYNKLYGATNNPYDLTRIPGGSSGGEGSLIAAGGSIIGIGSDIAGSVRMPAFFCGIYGHKPTPGIISLEGRPLTKRVDNPLCVLGPMCRYIEDLIPFYKVLAGENINKIPRIDEDVNVRQLTVYYMLGCKDPLVTPLDSDCRIAVEKAVAYFKGMGLRCVEVDIPEFHNAFNIWLRKYVDNEPVSYVEVLKLIKKDVCIWKEILNAFIGKSTFTNRTLALTLLTELELWHRRRTDMDKFRNDYKEFQERFHSMLGDNAVFLYPSHPEVAPKHEMHFMKVFNMAYTAIFNVLEVPVTQCPMGLNVTGIPTGVQIAAGPYNDHLSIAVAKELDKAFGGWTAPS